MKLNKQLIISIAVSLVGLNIFHNYIQGASIGKLVALFTLIAISLASLGITEYIFGNKNKRFTYQEMFIDLAIIVGILLAITYFFSQLTFGQNVFAKQALALIQ